MINNYFVFMPFSTFSWYTGNVFTFCSGTGNDALLANNYLLMCVITGSAGIFTPVYSSFVTSIASFKELHQLNLEAECRLYH
jgi:hypothetical protein